MTALAPAGLARHEVPGTSCRDALEPAVLRLHARFAGVEVEVVRRVLEDSYDQLLARATVTSFLVILAERTAATRLAAGQRSSTTALASTIALPSTTTTM